MAKLAPAFREYAREQPAINSRLALEAKKIEAIERRTALMEREAAERARKRDAREAQKRESAARAREKETHVADKRVSKPSAEFAARRAEIEAILDTARTEIAEQLLLLCEQWASSDVTVARCCAELSKLAKTLC